MTSVFTRNEVAAMVSESREGGLLEHNDEALLLGALRFEARSVANLVIPLDQVSSLPQGSPRRRPRPPPSRGTPGSR